MGLDGSIDDSFNVRAEPSTTFIRSAQMRDQTGRLRRRGVSRNQSAHGAWRHTERGRGGFHARRDRPFPLQDISDGSFTQSSLGPAHLIDLAEGLDALIELHGREMREPSKLAYGNLSKVGPDSLPYLCASASQALQLAYTAVPQHEFAGSQFQAKGRIGRYGGR